jgi:hypothetical protein
MEVLLCNASHRSSPLLPIRREGDGVERAERMNWDWTGLD